MAFKIKVPGSTANLGPGFDSIGLALNRYLELECAPSDQWSFRYHSPGYESLPTDKSNFIYKIYQKTAEQYGLYEPLPACRVDLVTDIPLERGLGSSAAAVVAGIELADQLLSLRLTKEEKAILASRFEGHPDNAGASV
ncbi:MAG: homoserine kinase [Tuberibacillus sp.]